MNSNSTTQKNSLYYQRISRLVEQHGKAEEKQLLRRWQRDLLAFFALAEPMLLSQRQHLEIGIQSTLALKLNLKSPVGSPGGVKILSDFSQASSALLPWADLAIRLGLRCHMGIKCTPQQFSRELYIYLGTAEHRAAACAIDSNLEKLLTMQSGLFIGVDDCRGLSVYFAPDEKNDYPEKIAYELGLPREQLQGGAIQQIRLLEGIATAGKSGMDLDPLTAPVLARLLSHYPLPWFRYLFTGAKLGAGFFGGDHVSRAYSLYANVT